MIQMTFFFVSVVNSQPLSVQYLSNFLHGPYKRALMIIFILSTGRVFEKKTGAISYGTRWGAAVKQSSTTEIIDIKVVALMNYIERGIRCRI